MQLLLVAVLILFSFLAEASKTDLIIPEMTSIRWNESVKLGSIVEGQFADPEIMNRVYDIVVLPASSKDEIQTLTSEQIALSLRQKLSFQDLQRVSLRIPELVKLKPVRNYIYPQDVKRQIFQTAFQQCACEVKVNDLKLPVLKNGDEILDIKIDNSAQKGAGSVLVPMLITTSKSRQQFYATATVQFYKEAPVAKRLLQAGERINKDDVVLKVVNVSFAKDGVPTIEDVLNKQVSRLVSVGQPLFFADIKKVPAAERGQPVKVVAGSENFEVTTQGIAEDTGFVGDVIRVKNIDTKKIMSGTVLEKGVVKLQ